LFYCFEAKIGGDCLALVQHITGLEVQDAAHFLAPKEATVPQAGRAETTAPKKEFDPAVFAQKLVFSPEVSALGISEERCYEARHRLSSSTEDRVLSSEGRDWFYRGLHCFQRRKTCYAAEMVGASRL
jgi:hypothetical protein